MKRHVVYHKTTRRFDKIHPPRSPAHLSLTIENNYWFYQGFLSRARTHNKSFYFFSVTSVTTHHTTLSVSRNKSTIKTSFNKQPSIQLFRGVFTFHFSSFSPNFVLALFLHLPHRVTLVTAKKWNSCRKRARYVREKSMKSMRGSTTQSNHLIKK